MLWKHLWKCADRRGGLEDWQDEDIPQGAPSYIFFFNFIAFYAN